MGPETFFSRYYQKPLKCVRSTQTHFNKCSASPWTLTAAAEQGTSVWVVAQRHGNGKQREKH